MLPTLDPNATLADFQSPDAWLSTSPLVDYEQGALALNDPTGGLQQADWEGSLVGGEYQVRVLPDGPPTPVLTITGVVSEARFAFDPEMRPHVTWVADEVAYLYWYDAELPGYATLELLGATSPRLCLDDKRPLAISPATLLFYLDGTSLYMRSHLTRFQTATLVAAVPSTVVSLGRVGMSVENRLQIELYLAAGAVTCDPNGPQLSLTEQLYADAMILSADLSTGKIIEQLYADATILSGTLEGDDPCAPYERPAFDEADASFADAYSRPASDAANFNLCEDL